MVRQARLFIPGCPVLIELRAAAGLEVFASRDVYACFRQHMVQAASTELVQLHAYSLTPSTVRVLLSCGQAAQVGRWVQQVNRLFSPFAKAVHPKHLSHYWEPRFKSTVIQPGLHALKACLFVDTHAQVIGRTHDLATYPWSSFGAHAGVINEPWLVDLPIYWQLGNTPFERQSRYRQFVEHGLSQVDLQAIEEHLSKGWLWGDSAFALQIADQANRSPLPRRRGRPTNNRSP